MSSTQDRVAARFSGGERIHACMQALDRKDAEPDTYNCRILRSCAGWLGRFESRAGDRTTVTRQYV